MFMNFIISAGQAPATTAAAAGTADSANTDDGNSQKGLSHMNMLVLTQFSVLSHLPSLLHARKV